MPYDLENWSRGQKPETTIRTIGKIEDRIARQRRAAKAELLRQRREQEERDRRRDLMRERLERRREALAERKEAKRKEELMERALGGGGGGWRTRTRIRTTRGGFNFTPIPTQTLGQAGLTQAASNYLMNLLAGPQGSPLPTVAAAPRKERVQNRQRALRRAIMEGGLQRPFNALQAVGPKQFGGVSELGLDELQRRKAQELIRRRGHGGGIQGPPPGAQVGGIQVGAPMGPQWPVMVPPAMGLGAQGAPSGAPAPINPQLQGAVVQMLGGGAPAGTQVPQVPQGAPLGAPIQNPAAPVVGGLNAAVQGALGGIMAGQVPEAALNRGNALAEAVLAPEERRFREVTLPRVREAFGGGGSYWGGARARAEERANVDFNERMAALRAQILRDMENRAVRDVLGGAQIGAGYVPSMLGQGRQDVLAQGRLAETGGNLWAQQQQQARANLLAGAQLAPQLGMLSDPYWAQRELALRLAGGNLGSARWFENVIQPWQIVNERFI